MEAGELERLGHITLGPGRWEYEDVRNRALVLLAGPMDEKGWPPRHPSHPSMKGKVPANAENDGAKLWKAIETLGMDELAYEVLVQEARELVKRHDFRQLEIGITHLLEQGHVVGPDLLEAVEQITQQETKTLPASAGAVDNAPAGRFGVLCDLHGREAGGDRVAAEAFARTIKRWQ